MVNRNTKNIDNTDMVIAISRMLLLSSNDQRLTALVSNARTLNVSKRTNVSVGAQIIIIWWKVFGISALCARSRYNQ